MPLQPVLLPTVCASQLCFYHVWFMVPSHCCGGAFAVVCLDILTWVVYPVSVPCHLHHSYAVEVYISWVLCRVGTLYLPREQRLAQQLVAFQKGEASQTPCPTYRRSAAAVLTRWAKG